MDTRIARRLQGFTLVEVMVVVVILAILAAIIVPRIASRPDQAKVAKVKLDIQTLETALDLYRLDRGKYPTNNQGLEVLVVKGYVKKLTPDPWGNPYFYLYPGDRGELDIFSYGADGESGGEGVNSDIGNW